MTESLGLLEPAVWLLLGILSAGILVQAAAGFAGGLVIVPLMLWAGYSVPEAQSALLVATIPQNVAGVWSFRDAIEPNRLVGPAMGRLIALPIGVAALQWMESASMVLLRQLVGGCVLAATLATWWLRPTQRDSVAPFWGCLAFPTSGFLQGIVGMGGPVMVFWVQAHRWDTRQSRGFLFAMYLVSIVPAMIILYLFFGGRIVAPGLIAGMAIPWLLVVTQMGLRLGTWLGTERLRRVTLVLLFLIGLTGLLTPLLR
ncbi:MAG: sulfite exporter TauE/SafE family protein [Planctomycetota bacterium]